jgi:RNA polymerase-interacting CarD/CdnL/TRCF family regulator
LPRRLKLSTTVSPEGYAVLRDRIRSGKVRNLAQAVDLVVRELRRVENKRKLAHATAQYYETASEAAIDEENALAAGFDPDAPADNSGI